MSEQIPADELYVTDSTGEPKQADSKEEVWISNSLHKSNLFFYFQYSIDGGKTIPGGLVVDWVVNIGGYAAMEFFGKFWHNGVKDDKDQLKLSRLEKRFNRVVVLTEKEVWDQESADEAIRHEFV